MGISCLRWRVWGPASRSQAGAASLTPVLRRPLSPWVEMTGDQRREKAKSFILRPSVRKGLWSKFNHLTTFLKVKRQLYDLLDLGQHLKEKKKKEKKVIPFLRHHFCF